MTAAWASREDSGSSPAERVFIREVTFTCVHLDSSGFRVENRGREKLLDTSVPERRMASAKGTAVKVVSSGGTVSIICRRSQPDLLGRPSR